MTNSISIGRQGVTVAASAAAFTLFSLFSPTVLAACKNPLVDSSRAARVTSSKQFALPSQSSFPTISAGQHVKAGSVDSGIKPKAGDLVILKAGSSGHLFLKRVVAFGPTTVQMRQGRLYIGGNKVSRAGPISSPREVSKDQSEICTRPDGDRSKPSYFMEKLPNGARYTIAECTDDSRSSDESKPITVPAGHAFVLGDNRDNSNDSRFSAFGTIPVSRITHVAICAGPSTLARVEKAAPTVFRILYIAIALSVAAFFVLLFIFWRRKRAA